MTEAIVRCRFYTRTLAEGGWYYDPIYISSPESDGMLPTTHPPAVGDVVYLWDSLAKTGGMYRVVQRFWMHAGFGSMVWRYMDAMPSKGPELQMLVELAQGMFVDEVSREDETDDEEDATDA